MGVLPNKPTEKCSRLGPVRKPLMLVRIVALLRKHVANSAVCDRVCTSHLDWTKSFDICNYVTRCISLFIRRLTLQYYLFYFCRRLILIDLFLNILEMFKFEVPSLTVGTLDTLMTLSDDLVKTDGVVESTVRKIERTTAELFGGKSSDLTVGGQF